MIADHAVLNANYLKARLDGTYHAPFDRTCMHEFVVEGRWDDAPGHPGFRYRQAADGLRFPSADVLLPLDRA